MELQKINQKISAYKTDRGQYPSVSKIKKQSGEREAIKTIVELLVWFREQINVSRNLSEEQIFTTAEIILHEFYWLNAADIKICMTNGLAGKYGELYERMDSTIICRWLNEYENERISKIEYNDRPKLKIDYEKLKALARLKTIELKKKEYRDMKTWCNDFKIDYDKICQLIEAHKTERLEILGDCRMDYIKRKLLSAINEFGLETENEAKQIIKNIK